MIVIGISIIEQVPCLQCVSGSPIDVFQLGAYQTILAAFLCTSVVLIVIPVLVLCCRHRWLVRRRRLRRERKLRQQSKNHRQQQQQRHDDPPSADATDSRCKVTVHTHNQLRLPVREESSKTEVVVVACDVRGTPPGSFSAAVPSVHNVCHCLPRGLRRKSPSTAVIRRGRSVESLLAVGRRPSGGLPAGAVPRLMHANSVAVIPRRGSAGSRSVVMEMPTTPEREGTSGPRRWAPITVAGETMFPVQPSAAVCLSFDVDDLVRYSCRQAQET